MSRSHYLPVSEFPSRLIHKWPVGENAIYRPIVNGLGCGRRCCGRRCLNAKTVRNLHAMNVNLVVQRANPCCRLRPKPQRRVVF